MRHGRAPSTALLLAAGLLAAGCEQPFVVQTAPWPIVDAEIDAAATVAGVDQPADLARARGGLDALVAAWDAPESTGLHAEGATALRKAKSRAETLSRRAESGRALRLGRPIEAP